MMIADIKQTCSANRTNMVLRRAQITLVLIGFSCVSHLLAAPSSSSRKSWVGAASDAFVPKDPYIVGGEAVHGREFPAQVSIRIFGQHNCGGSILNSNWILTAAHCSQPLALFLTVFSGSNLLDSGGTKHRVKEIHYHEEYDPSHAWANDIAVMRVDPFFDMGNGVAPIKLPRKGQETPTGSDATIVGWGRLSTSGPISNELRKVDVKIFDHENCSKVYAVDGLTIHDTQICAGGCGGKDACNGDSGGPLLVNGEMVGIVSWGRPCAQEGFPTVYTQVADYIDWIEEHIKC